MSGRLRVGVAGLGVGILHVRAWQALPERFEVAAVCDVDPARVHKVAEKLEVARAFTDFGALLRCDDLDVIDVATPPSLHFDQCRAALESGRHVVCEKPLVASLAHADDLARIEAAVPGRLMPIFQYRFGAGLLQLLRLVERGVTGRAYLSTVETAWRRGADYYAVPWRGRWATELGGVLLSHAIHAHDLLCSVVGPIRSVFAHTATRVNPIETEDCAAASLRMADGSLATLSATLGSQVEISRLRFCFENLTAESGLAPYAPSQAPWTFAPRDAGVQREIDAALEGFDPGPEGYAGQFLRLHRALGDGGELPVTVGDARASLELVTALYHSAETGTAVQLPLGPEHPKYEGWLPPGGGVK